MTKRFLVDLLSELMWPLILLTQFFLCVNFLSEFRLTHEGFQEGGWHLFIYNLSKIFIAFDILISIILLGFILISGFLLILRKEVKDSERYSQESMIIYSVTGFTAMAIFFTALALSNNLHVTYAKAIFVFSILFSKSTLPNVAKFFKDTAKYLARCIFGTSLLLNLISSVLLVIIIFGLFNAAVFIPVFDPNIWEHYIHYYREVILNAGSMPNMVWHHFYASKAAGFNFFVLMLTDESGLQIASTVITVLTVLILFDILRKSVSSKLAALGAFSVFCYIAYIGFFSGMLHKHHPFILFFITTVIWYLHIEWSETIVISRSVVRFILYILLSYFGFYQPTIAIIVVPAFFILLLIEHNNRKMQKTIFKLLFAFILGVISVLTFNYIKTGIFELTPASLMWKYANQSQFVSLFGAQGIQFFLNANNDVSPIYNYSLLIGIYALFFPLNEYIKLALIILLFVSLVGKDLLIFNYSRCEKKLLEISMAFIVPSYFCAQLYQTAAATRLGYLTLAPMTIVTVTLFAKIAEAFMRSAYVVKYKYLARISLLLLCGLMSYSFLDEFKRSKLLLDAVAYDSGFRSLSQTISALDKKDDISFTVAELKKFKQLNGEGKIVRLTYDFGFVYSYPTPGIFSEPTFSIIDSTINLRKDSPEKVAHYLIDRNYRFFTIDLQKPFFSSLIFSGLFDTKNLEKYFSVVYRNGNKYILELKEVASISKFESEIFLNLFEIKKTSFFFQLKDPKSFIDEISILNTNSFDEISHNCHLVKAAFSKRYRSEYSLIEFDSTKRILDTILAEVLDENECTISDFNLDPSARYENFMQSVLNRLTAYFGAPLANELTNTNENILFTPN